MASDPRELAREALRLSEGTVGYVTREGIDRWMAAHTPALARAVLEMSDAREKILDTLDGATREIKEKKKRLKRAEGLLNDARQYLGNHLSVAMKIDAYFEEGKRDV